MSKNNFSFFAILNWALTFWVDGVAMEIPIPDPGSTDKTLYCEKQQSKFRPMQGKHMCNKSRHDRTLEKF